MKKIEEIAQWIYEAGRLEFDWSNKEIVSEHWENTSQEFKNQFIDLIDQYLKLDKFPTPEETHNSWCQRYLEMGWKYGEKRDTILKTHPDLVPFYELPKDERDKDSIFLSLIWLVRHLL